MLSLRRTALAVEQISAARKAAPDRRAQIEENAKRLRRELDRLVAVIAAGQSSQTILAEIMHREERLQALEAERERLTVTLIPGGRDLERVRAATIEQAIRFREALRGELSGARDTLQKLIPRPVSFIPDETAPSGYRLEGETVVGPLFGQVWRPQGDLSATLVDC